MQNRSKINFVYETPDCRFGFKHLYCVIQSDGCVDGLWPGPSKVEAINKLPAPTSKEEVKRFLG